MLKTTTCLAALLCAAGAQAQDFDDLRLGSAVREGWRVGGALVDGPAYKGSDQHRAALVPLVEYRAASGWFAGVGSGLGYEFLHRPDTNAGVRLTLDGGRRERRSDALTGMGNIGARPEIGAYVNHALLTPGLGLHGEMRYGAGGKGLLATLGVAYGLGLAPTLRLRLGAEATLANGDYMQTFFGVSDAQSASSGYAPFQAKSGVRDTRLSATLLYAITPKLALTGGLAASTLHSDAANSPLTREGTGVSVLSTLTYGF